MFYGINTNISSVRRQIEFRLRLAKSLKSMLNVNLSFKTYFKVKSFNVFMLKDVPEVSVSPSKVFVNSPPTLVRFNCLVSSYPESEIIWMYSSHLKDSSHGKRQIILSKVSHRHFKHHRNVRRLQTTDTQDVHEFVLENTLSHSSSEKYQISLQSMNETFKQSSIVINVEDENDLGVYSCHANNSIGSKSVKFFIYGG